MLKELFLFATTIAGLSSCTGPHQTIKKIHLEQQPGCSTTQYAGYQFNVHLENRAIVTSNMSEYSIEGAAVPTKILGSNVILKPNGLKSFLIEVPQATEYLFTGKTHTARIILALDDSSGALKSVKVTGFGPNCPN